MAKFTEHLEYNHFRKDWERYRNLYEGDRDVIIGEYLVAHEFEENANGKRLGEIRRTRSQYTNYIRPFIRRFASIITEGETDYSKAIELIGEDEASDIDGYGNSLEDFLRREVAENYFLFGKIGIFVDSFNIEAKNKKEEQELGLRPFMQVWNPLAIIDWQYQSLSDRVNNLDFAAYRYNLIEDRANIFEELKENEYVKYLYLDEAGFYNVEEYRKIRDGDYELVDSTLIQPRRDYIPLAIIDSTSWIKDASYKAIQLFNLESVLDNIHLFQAHQRLVGIGDFKKDDSGTYAFSEANLVILPTNGSSASLEVIQPVDTTSLERRIEQVKLDMLKIIFNQQRELPSDSKASQSHETLQASKEDFKALAVNAAKDITSLFNQAIYHYVNYKQPEGKEIPFDEYVSIPVDITEENLQELMLLITGFSDRINRFPTWRKSVDMMAVKRMGLPETDDIIQEIQEGKELELEEQDPIADLFNGISENGRQQEETATPAA